MKIRIFAFLVVVLSCSPCLGQTNATATSTNSLKRVRVFVSGRVQGVGFRNFVRFRAYVHKLKGWVRNLPDKRVELVAEGPAHAIEKLLKAVAKGPSGARVDKVERKDEPYKGEFKRFQTKR